MLLNVTLGILVCLVLLFCMMCYIKLMGVKRRLCDMTEALSDIQAGNGNRKILAADNELTAELSYKMNAIVYAYIHRTGGACRINTPDFEGLGSHF